MRGLAALALVMLGIFVSACGSGGSSEVRAPGGPTAATDGSPTVAATDASPTVAATPTPQPSTLIAYEVITQINQTQGTTILQAVQDIYGVDIESGERTQLINNPGMYVSAWSWSPDGKHLAALMQSRNLNADRDARLDVVAADGSGQRTLWSAHLTGPAIPGNSQARGEIASFVWNPDGAHIDLIAGSAQSVWWRIPVDGQPSRQIATLSASGITHFAARAWVDNGRRLLVARQTSGPEFEFSLYAADGAFAETIAPPEGKALSATLSVAKNGATVALDCYVKNPDGTQTSDLCLWEAGRAIRILEGVPPGRISPDGVLLLATVQDPARQPVFFRSVVVDLATGKHVTQLDDTFNGVWSPDSKALASLSDRDQPTVTPGQIRQRQLYVMAADGSGLRKITDETLPLFGTPQWQPR